MGQATFLSASKSKEMGNDYNPFTSAKNAPTQEEIFLNPVLRRDLAAEFGVKPIPMPAVGRRSGMDLEPFKRSLAEGVHGSRLQASVPRMTEDDLLYVFWALNATPEDIAAANAAGE